MKINPGDKVIVKKTGQIGEFVRFDGISIIMGQPQLRPHITHITNNEDPYWVVIDIDGQYLNFKPEALEIYNEEIMKKHILGEGKCYTDEFQYQGFGPSMEVPVEEVGYLGKFPDGSVKFLENPWERQAKETSEKNEALKKENAELKNENACIKSDMLEIYNLSDRRNIKNDK